MVHLQKINSVKALLIPICLLYLLVSSCDSSEKKKPEPIPEVKLEYPDKLEHKLYLFPQMEFDLKIDSAFFKDENRNNTKNKLSLEDVSFLSEKLNHDELSESDSYYLKNYLKIAQSKREGSYEAYLSSLDLGMTKDANCFALGRLEFGDSMALLIWKIDYSSYEACPMFSGTHILGTMIYKGNLGKTMQLAAYESAADAPMNSESFHLASINKYGQIKGSNHVMVKEMDLTVEEIHQKYFYIMGGKGFVKP